MTPSLAEIANQTKLELATEMLGAGGRVYLRALGASMIPAVWPGDLLAIEGAEATSLLAGEIVLIYREGRFFIHRLICAGSGSGAADWITRGDALPRCDPAVAAGDVMGRVSGIMRGRRMLVPRRQLSWAARICVRMLRSSGLLRGLALRWHAVRRRLSVAETGRLHVHNSPHFSTVAHLPGE